MEHGDKAGKAGKARKAGKGLKESWQEAAVLSSHRAAPSLGHYASLSFIVIGKAQRTEGTILISHFQIRNPKSEIRNNLALCSMRFIPPPQFQNPLP
jgi:hypothetical protein